MFGVLITTIYGLTTNILKTSTLFTVRDGVTAMRYSLGVIIPTFRRHNGQQHTCKAFYFSGGYSRNAWRHCSVKRSKLKSSRRFGSRESIDSRSHAFVVCVRTSIHIRKSLVSLCFREVHAPPRLSHEASMYPQGICEGADIFLRSLGEI